MERESQSLMALLWCNTSLGLSYLVRRVGPGIAEVKIEVQALAGGLGSLGELQVVIQVVVSITWVDPEPLTDRVDARRC